MIRRRNFLFGTVALAGLHLAGPAWPARQPRAGRGNRQRGDKTGKGDGSGNDRRKGGGGAERPVDTSNTLTLRDASGSGATDYPMRIGRPFVQGEIANAPQAVIGGTPVPTQADIKTRWPDGSVKQAVLSFVVAHIPGGGTVKVAFANQKAPQNAALTREQMLARDLDFDATMQISRDGKTQKVSARDMLSKGDYTVWCQGPIATTIVLADHSTARKYDFGFEATRPVRPIFHATFWPSLRKVQVRVIGENSNTETLQDIVYDLVVTGGSAKPAEAFRQDGVTHFAATRWSRNFWIGGDPNPQIDIDHNIGYLSRTFAFPNFDPSLAIPDQVMAQFYAKWQREPRNLYDDGGWMKAMNAAGGRMDIGPYPEPQALWLLSGDHRMLEMVSTQADLAGAWPLQVREGDAAKRFDAAKKVPGLGRPISVYARPSLWLFDSRGRTTAEDAVDIRGERVSIPGARREGGNWHADGAHQPDPYSALYTLTGDFFALEQLQFWAAADVLGYNAQYKGPAPSGGVFDQVRGNAWILRNRVHAAFLSPDASPEKLYFTSMIDDAVSFWEGMHDIRGTKFEGSPLWEFAKAHRLEKSPLHFFRENEVDSDDMRGELKGGTFSAAAEMWQQYFLIFELGRAKEKGFPTGTLLSYTGALLTGQFLDPAYSPYNVQRYNTALRAKNGKYYETWAETLTSYINPAPPMPFKPDVCDGYASYAYGASTMMFHEPGGDKAYAWLKENAYDARRERYTRCPKWAFLARA